MNLKWKDGCYNLFMAKKNGQPKQDLPCYNFIVFLELDYDQVLSEYGSLLFAITMNSKLSI